MNEIFRQKTQEEWVSFFDGADICFSPVNDLHQAVQDPQILHRKMIVDVEIENRKNLLIGIPIKLSETPGEIRATFPNHGEHTSEILMKVGYSKKEIKAMAAMSIV